MRFPSNTKVSPEVYDVLTKMLVYNPKKRIEWHELFEHRINKMQEEKIMKDLEDTMKNQDIQNISRFYIKNNKVIDHPEEIEKKKDINEYAYKASKNTMKSFNGKVINRKYNRSNQDDAKEDQDPFKRKTAESENNGKVSRKETDRERKIRIFKQNTSRILHERNKYVFLASVAEDAISFSFKYSDLIGFILIKKLFKMLCELKFDVKNKKNTFNLPMWKDYIKSRDFRKIGDFIFNEYELFESYYENLNKNVKKKFTNTKSKNIEKVLKA